MLDNRNLNSRNSSPTVNFGRKIMRKLHDRTGKDGPRQCEVVQYLQGIFSHLETDALSSSSIGHEACCASQIGIDAQIPESGEKDAASG
ncbi:MAG: hypothetical protein AB7U49_12750 [Hyphomicrobiaceae bacterium]